MSKVAGSAYAREGCFGNAAGLGTAVRLPAITAVPHESTAGKGAAGIYSRPRRHAAAGLIIAGAAFPAHVPDR